MPFPPELAPLLVDAVAQFLLAAAILALGFGRRATRAFALFLVVTGMGNLLATLPALVSDPALAAFFWRVAVYFWLPFPLALAYFALVFPERRSWIPRRLPLGAVAVAAMAVPDALYLLDHTAYWGTAAPGGGLANGPLASFLGLIAGPTVAGVALVFARDYTRAPAGASRSSSFIVSLSVTLVAVFASLVVAARRVFFGTGSRFFGDAFTQDVALVVRLLFLSALVVLLARHLLRSESLEERRSLRRYLLALLVPAGSVGLVVALRARSAAEGAAAQVFVSGLWDLVFAALVTYALVRHRLLGLDLRIKWTIRHSTIAAAFIAVYIVVSQAAGTLLAGSLGPYLGLAATALLVFAIVPLQGLAERVAERAMPGVGSSRDYLQARRLDVYRAALEQAYSDDGAVTAKEAKMLGSLRAQLGVTDRDHGLLEQAVRASAHGGPARLDTEPGALFLGRYRVERLLGEGAFGSTTLARDTVLHREVAIKSLHHSGDRADAAETFLQEARLLGSLRHPNLVTVYDLERIGERAFIVMEYADAGSLEELLRQRGRLGVIEAVRVADGLLAGLEAAHARGLVHRDVKPANVLLTRDGGVKVSDFGSAREVARDQAATRTGLTLSGGVGTLATMSPEAARGGRLDHRSDLYSAGAVLYRMLTGHDYLDLRGKSEFEAREAILTEPPRLPVRVAPRAVNDLLAAALAKDPTERPTSARAMRLQLAVAMASAAEARRSSVPSPDSVAGT